MDDTGRPAGAVDPHPARVRRPAGGVDLRFMPLSGRLLSAAQMAAKFGVCRATVYQLARDDPRFPTKRRIGRRRVGWIEREIDDYIAGLGPGTSPGGRAA